MPLVNFDQHGNTVGMYSHKRSVSIARLCVCKPNMVLADSRGLSFTGWLFQSMRVSLILSSECSLQSCQAVDILGSLSCGNPDNGKVVTTDGQ